jgi:hypothetical protein
VKIAVITVTVGLLIETGESAGAQMATRMAVAPIRISQAGHSRSPSEDRLLATAHLPAKRSSRPNASAQSHLVCCFTDKPSPLPLYRIGGGTETVQIGILAASSTTVWSGWRKQALQVGDHPEAAPVDVPK